MYSSHPIIVSIFPAICPPVVYPLHPIADWLLRPVLYASFLKLASLDLYLYSVSVSYPLPVTYSLFFTVPWFTSVSLFNPSSNRLTQLFFSGPYSIYSVYVFYTSGAKSVILTQICLRPNMDTHILTNITMVNLKPYTSIHSYAHTFRQACSHTELSRV